jgi:hypothetical protein
MSTWRKIALVLCMFMVLLPAFIVGTPTDLVGVTFCLWIVANYLQAFHPQRQTIRWLVLASGLISLVVAALLLPMGLGVLQGSLSRMPRWVMLILSAAFFAVGPVTIWEGLSGTLVRKHGLEIFGAIHTRAVHPWPRIIVKDWQERDGGFVLRLTILSLRQLGMASGRDVEMILPVLAAERPALEAFLAEHAANTA